MKQVVVNLLTNAIKFSPRGGVVELVTRSDGPFAVIEVRDQGPGVKAEDRGAIFELFGQGAQSGSNQPSGLGIGLHLVRRITEMHDGKVGVETLPQGGSLFWIRLPLLAEDHGTGPAPEGTPLPQAA
jgi:signal transduction histidine kinase